MTVTYTVLIEQGPTSFGAYIPDLPGCVAVGKSVEEVERLIREAMEFHLEGMLADGDAIPEAATRSGEVEVDLDKIAETVRAQAGSP
jgi:predicted RNase H-like HicB family nuclease